MSFRIVSEDNCEFKIVCVLKCIQVTLRWQHTAEEERLKRLTRQESREQTRTRLIQAAYELFSSEGIESTSIDRITEAAGYSRGAFYSNFETKEEIAALIAERESTRTREVFERIEAAALSPEGMMEALRDYALQICANRQACLFDLELKMYGVRHPEMRAVIGKYADEDAEVASAFIDRLFAAFGVSEHPPSRLIVNSFVAMAQGLTMRQIVEPQTLSADIMRDALSVYFDSVVTSCIPQLRKTQDHL
jgi:AcrR family transcriptional regulator